MIQRYLQDASFEIQPVETAGEKNEESNGYRKMLKNDQDVERKRFFVSNPFLSLAGDLGRQTSPKSRCLHEGAGPAEHRSPCFFLWGGFGEI